MGFLDECRSAFPKVVIRVSDGDSLGLESKIASASVDIAILYEDAFTTPLARVPLFKQKLFLVSRKPIPDQGTTISLKRVAELEFNNRLMIMDGILAIQSGDSPRKVEHQLLAYLPPKDRDGVKRDKDKAAA